MIERTKVCDKRGCKGTAFFEGYCGAYVCASCGKHVGLARCYCGWSASGRDGRRELEEMGEVIGDESEVL